MSDSGELPKWVDVQSCKLLLELVSRGEGQSIEFKRELPLQGHDIGKSIAAFASSNTGHLVYGVSDDSTIVGLPNAADAQQRDEIARRIFGAAGHVRPPVLPSICWAQHQEKVVCIVRVERGVDAIYYSNHRPIIRAGAISRPAEPADVEQAFRRRYAEGATAPRLPSTQQIAKRMQRAISLMSGARSEPISVADLAKAMELPSPADLDIVLQGHRPPTFALLDQFCDRFAIDKEWLTTERGSPFSGVGENRYYPEECAQQLAAARPEVVYAVRSTSRQGEAFFIAEIDSLKFWRLPGVWHVSDEVGGGGASQLLSLYRLFKTWPFISSQTLVLGRSIQPKLAQAILQGSTYPSVVARLPGSHWWEDLTDLEHKWTTRKKSAESYGPGFVAAQDIIRRMLVDSAHETIRRNDAR